MAAKRERCGITKMKGNMPKKIQHTPTPWRVGRSRDGHTLLDKFDNQIAECSKYGAAFVEAGQLGPFELCEQNAKYIAKCVNRHDELVEVAKAALALILDDGKQGGTAWTIKALRKAIANTEGKQ
jgi:hypothetical protein